MKTAILGFGNPVRSDDGVGCQVVALLQKLYAEQPDVSIFDMGTSAFETLFQLQGHDRIIIVDAVINSGEPDGCVFKLPTSTIEAAIIDDPMVFLHGLKWDQALSYAKKILQDQFPKEEIYAYLVAVSNISLEVGLSETVAKAAEEVVQHIQQQLAEE